MDWITAERVKALANFPETDTTMDAYWGECAENGNQAVEAAAGGVGDASQLGAGSPHWRMLSSVAGDIALSFHYVRQGWPERARPLRQDAERRLEAAVARLKAELPESQGITAVHGSWAGGHVVYDPAGSVALGLG